AHRGRQRGRGLQAAPGGRAGAPHRRRGAAAGRGGLMRVAVVREIKVDEHRVALTPDGAADLAAAGHEVLVERGAGAGSGFPDEAYAAAGAALVDVAEAWERADLVVKVKEPLAEEWPRLRPGLVLFTFLHLAPDPALTEALTA